MSADDGYPTSRPTPPGGSPTAAVSNSERIAGIAYLLFEAAIAVDAMRQSIESEHARNRADAADAAVDAAITDLRALAISLEPACQAGADRLMIHTEVRPAGEQPMVVGARTSVRSGRPVLDPTDPITSAESAAAGGPLPPAPAGANQLRHELTAALAHIDTLELALNSAIDRRPHPEA